MAMNQAQIALETNRLREFPLRWLLLGSALLVAGAAILALVQGPPTYVTGQQVMAHCKDSYLLGKIQRVRASGYAVKFGADTRPITCTPYLWKAAYLSAYQPVAEYHHDGRTLHPGDTLTLRIKVNKQLLPLGVKILDLTADGLARLEVLDGDPLARGFFEKHFGSNYVRIASFSSSSQG